MTEDYNKGLEEGRKEALNEVKEVFDKWIRDSNINVIILDESNVSFARKVNDYIQELREQLLILGEKKE